MTPTIGADAQQAWHDPLLLFFMGVLIFSGQSRWCSDLCPTCCDQESKDVRGSGGHGAAQGWEVAPGQAGEVELRDGDVGDG